MLYAPLCAVFADGVVGDFVPTQPCHVKFPRAEADYGNKLDAADARRDPAVTWGTAAPTLGALCTVLMLDPDAPSPRAPRDRSFIHWLVVDAPASSGSASSGRILLPYKPPTPPSGNHRFAVLLCEQSHAHTRGAHTHERAGVDVTSFMEILGLRPVGINFFCVHSPEKFGKK